MPDRFVGRVIGVAAVALTISGCADVSVTESEYRLAFAQFAECMSLGGYELVEVDDSGRVIEYSFPAEAVDAGVEPECYAPFRPVDMAWQVQN